VCDVLAIVSLLLGFVGVLKALTIVLRFLGMV
jgi:hypothetical protein